MPVEVATFRGERFPHGDGKHEPYRDARTAVTLGAGEERAITIRSDFEPQKLIVDPTCECSSSSGRRSPSSWRACRWQRWHGPSETSWPRGQ
jgi:hypothetical protein